MSELIKPPSDWHFHPGLVATVLSGHLSSSNHRLLSIKSLLDGTARVYAGVSVKDPGLGGSWDGHIAPTDLTTTLGTAFRLTALDCFEEHGKTFCAGAWVSNQSASAQKNWGHDLTPDELTDTLKKNTGKLINLRAYQTTLGGKLPSPETRYCAIWMQDDGVEWDWIPNAVADSIADTIDAKSARLVSIDNLDNTTWLGDDEHFCAVWYRNVGGKNWFWNIGLGKSDLQTEAKKFCSWGLDLSFCSKSRFVSLLVQYPKPADLSLANLMTFTGTAPATLDDDLETYINWDLTEEGLTSETVTMESAFAFNAAEGGWSWLTENATESSALYGLPLSITGPTSFSSTPQLHWTFNPKLGIFPIKLTSSAGHHQYLLPQIPISHDGFSTPSQLPIQWPIYMGIQAPVEVVKLTNGEKWVTVIAQIVNGTGKKLAVTHASVRLRNQNNVTVHKEYFTEKLRIDQDVHGNFLDPPIDGPMTDSDAPLPKFYGGFAVPRSFKSGHMKFQADVKFADSELACYGDARTVPVNFAPITVMNQLPYDTPIINGQAHTEFQWQWRNGIGGTTFNTHAHPEERYAYDLHVIDPSGETFKDINNLVDNDNYWVWGQPVLAMSAGTVICTYDSWDDNLGNTGKPADPNKQGTNIVVISDPSKTFFQLYAHFQKDQIVVGLLEPVQPGAVLGYAGNSGGTSEPHVHIAISRRDTNGVIRCLPMSFQGIKDGAGNTVSGTPVIDETYSA